MDVDLWKLDFENSGFKNSWINELKNRSKDHFADSKIELINLSFLESVRLKFFGIFLTSDKSVSDIL